MQIYYANIDDINLGLTCISLVEDEAVRSKFINFAADQPKQMMFKADEEHRTISGVALRADFPIYRIDEDGNPYYIVFEGKTIEQMVKRYAKNNLMNQVSLQHNGKLVDGIYLYESYIINKKRGIVPEEFKDIEDHSWIVSFYVEDDEIWNEIKNGNSLQGFSVECLINLQKKKLTPVTKQSIASNENSFQSTLEDPCDTLMNEILK